jgi:histidinol dehydrogenase
MAALTDHTRRFDRVVPPRWTLGRDELQEAWHSLPPQTQQALQRAAANIERFANAQRAAMQAFEFEIEPGVFVGQRLEPTASVACYVPGGRYPLPSTVLMTALPARAAGVQRVVILTPPGRQGLPDRHILAAAWLAGAEAVHPVGGVQAIGAAAYGAEEIAAVDLIVGPGNAWVTEAKRQVYGAVGIDSLAGPSEVMVLFDDSSNLPRVAADLLAQAEHDVDAHAIAVTDSRAAALQLLDEVERQLTTLPTADVARQSLQRHGIVVVVADRAAMAAAANLRRPEHLEVHTRHAAELGAQCTAFGGLFIGGDAAEVLGDYCAGPSHVLPTAGASRYTGGLGVQTFMRVLTTQRSENGASAPLAHTAALLARIEGLEGHARAADLRK